MTFGDKYEIVEAVTRGRVETFVARKIPTNQRVLVYVFEGREQKAEEPTVQWVLESFRVLAPSPPDVVVETGRYNGTSYAYLVTKLPERAVLKDWLRSYEAQHEDKRQLDVPPEWMPSANAVPERQQTSILETPASEQPTVVLWANHPEEITNAFGVSRSQSKLDVEAERDPAAVDAMSRGGFSPSASEKDLPLSSNVKPETGEFTVEAFSGFKVDHEKSTKSHLSGAPATTETQAPGHPAGELLTYDDGEKRERSPESPIGVFGGKPAGPSNWVDSTGLGNLLRSTSSHLQTKFPDTTSPEIASGKRDDIPTGEFTRFFQDPFNGEGPSSTPELSRPVSKQERTGDFTRLFGSTKESSSSGVGAMQTPNRGNPAGADEGTSTELFDSPEPQVKNSAVYQSGPELTKRVDGIDRGFAAQKPPTTPVSSESKATAETSAPFISSASNVSLEAETSFPSRHELEGATRVFSGPGADAVCNLSSLPAGPSDFTRIISGGTKSLIPSQEPPLVPTSQNAFSPHQSVPPPSSPSPAPIPISYPHPPAAPSIAPPPAPQLPKPGIAASTVTATTPWTLIIILNVLFILAVALVLYFALKH